MDNLMRCEYCRFVGQMDYVHGKFKCPQCKQIPPMGDCCQGETVLNNKPEDPCEGEDVPN
jgi:phage FluMu protein Com